MGPLQRGLREVHKEEDFTPYADSPLSCDENACPGSCSCYYMGRDEGRSDAEWQEEQDVLEELNEKLRSAVEGVLGAEECAPELRKRILELFQ